jgi:hypothetical protein
MSFDVVRARFGEAIRIGGAQWSMLVALALSDGTVRVYRYLPAAWKNGAHVPGRFEVLAKGKYGNTCLTQIKFADGHYSFGLVTAGTDGYLTAWDLTKVATSDPAASNTPYTLTPLTTTPLHPSNITSLTLQLTSYHIRGAETFGAEQNHKVRSYMILTTGDDGALGILRLNLNVPQPSGKGALGVQFGPRQRIDGAHAAAAAGVSCYRLGRTSEGMDGIGGAKDEWEECSQQEWGVVSVGGDQRVRRWRACVTPETVILMPDERNEVERIWSGVPDAQGIVGDGKTRTFRLVYGVGMEVWEVLEGNEAAQV